MGESIGVKMRVVKIEQSDPITAVADLATAEWDELPLTLRDDTVLIEDEDPEEQEVFSHENDAAEDYQIAGQGTTITGSFIKVKKQRLVELLGGTFADGVYQRSAKRISLNKALRFTDANGNTIVIPNAKGFVKTSADVGYSGNVKFPFKFKALAASPEWNVDMIM